MNYEQAREQVFNVAWKASECFTIPNCWCRIVVPVEPIFWHHPDYPDVKNEYVVIDHETIDQETAEYIVKLHNDKIAKLPNERPPKI